MVRGDNSKQYYCWKPVGNNGCSGQTLIRNNIVADNSGNGLQTADSPGPTTKFNDVYQNTPDYSGFSSLYGNLVSTNRNGDPADVYDNTSLDPQFVDTSAKDFHLKSVSHLIDAGDTLSVKDPDNTVTDIGAFLLQPGRRNCAVGRIAWFWQCGDRG